jgi:ATP-dependent phosphoenolpyruvate carboxykinase
MAKTTFGRNNKAALLGGLIIKTVTAAGLSSTPTLAQLNTALGTGASNEANYLVKLIDTTNTKVYLVTTDGTGWNYVAMTAAA